jgi:hypothetical protein
MGLAGSMACVATRLQEFGGGTTRLNLLPRGGKVKLAELLRHLQRLANHPLRLVIVPDNQGRETSLQTWMQFSSLRVSGGGEDRILKTKRESKATKLVLRTALPRTRSAESLHANTRAFAQSRPRKHNEGAAYRNRILSDFFEMQDVNLQHNSGQQNRNLASKHKSLR